MTHTTADGLADNYIRDIAVDRLGSTWIATARGLSRVGNGGWTTYTTADGMPDNDVWSLGVDSGNHLWLSGYWTGVTEFDGTTWIRHPAPD